MLTSVLSRNHKNTGGKEDKPYNHPYHCRKAANSAAGEYGRGAVRPSDDAHRRHQRDRRRNSRQD